MKIFNVRVSMLVAASGFLCSICFAQGTRQVAVGPWDFQDGNVTSRTMVLEPVRRIAEHQGLAIVSPEVVQQVSDSMGPGFGIRRGRPDLAKLSSFAASTHANIVIFGKASWHTRSIWVGTGPKTISTASITLYVFNARLGTVTYSKRNVEGRSDEKESTLKDVADVILTPLITVVSGGPATPREQRAAQIAIGRAMRPWVMQRNARRP